MKRRGDRKDRPGATKGGRKRSATAPYTHRYVSDNREGSSCLPQGKSCCPFAVIVPTLKA